ncbi:MAG: FmdB family zinc ribbon protein [Acidimicrobiales bacterium]
MPTYDYRCKACGQELEVFQSFSDDPLTTCEACGGELRKLFGAPGIAFKGSGFYKTDSRGGSKGASTAAGTTGEKKTSDSTASPSESSGNGSSTTKKEPAASSSSTGDAS